MDKMSEPVRLIPEAELLAGKVSADVVGTLNGWLSRAKDGEFAGLALIATTHDGSTVTTFTDNMEITRLLGALTILQFRMIGQAKGLDV